MATSEEVSVMIVSTASQGHINPTLRFAKRLISKGVHVTLISTELARNRMLKTQKNVSTTTNKQIQFEFFSDGLPLDFDREKGSGTFIESMQTIGSKNMSALITNLAETRNYSCIIVDPVMLADIGNVASTLGIPCAFLWMQPCATWAISYRYFNNINSFPNFENRNEQVQLPGLPLLQIKDFPSYTYPSFLPHARYIMVEMCKACDKNFKWVLSNTIYEFEEETVKSMESLAPVYPIGPLVSDFMLGGEKEENDEVSMDMFKVEDSIFEWLDNKPESSVIYIAFGSICVLSQEQVNNIATALKNSNKAFLWVIKPPMKGSEKDVTEMPEGFLEETKGRGLVVQWCQQEKVLTHPAIGSFLSHCGWNSMVETVAAGVPVIGYPVWLDQPTIAKVIVDQFHNGVIMNWEENGVPSVEEIERVIKEVMEGSSGVEIKKKALEMKEMSRKALEAGGSSDKSIDQFITEIVKARNAARAASTGGFNWLWNNRVIQRILSIIGLSH